MTAESEHPTDDSDNCELCGEECEYRVGCNQCGRLVCDDCLAWIPEDEQEERGEICESCF